MGMFKSDPPPPPNYTPNISAFTAQATRANDISQANLDWAHQQFEANRGNTDAIQANFVKAQEESLRTSAADRARYEGTYQPIENMQIADALDYSSEGRKDLNRGRAISGVNQQFEAARANTMRDLEGYGINPGAVRYAALDTGVRTQQAAAQAAAANQSDLATEATGRALRQDVINTGRGLPGQAAGELNASIGAGTANVNSDLATTSTGAATMGNPTAWAGLGTNALTGATSTMNTGYGNQMQYYDAQNAGMRGFGQAAGMAAGIGARYAFAAEGGEIGDAGATVPKSASPSNGRAIDDVDARLTPGEFVVPADVTNWYGEKFMQNLIVKAREGKQGAGAKPQMRTALPQGA